jgi:phytanoyl-CoA dioxygenase PhyH
VSVDLRTREDRGGPPAPVDPGELFGSALPEAAAAGASRLAPAIRWFGLKPLVVGCDGGAWTLSAEPALSVREATAGDPPVGFEVTPEQLTELVHDLATPMAWFSSGTLRADVPIHRLLDWWVLIRAALDGSTPYVPGDGLDREMAAAHDLRRTFRPDDEPEAMRTFLERAGYLHVSGVFSRDEMAAVSADMDAAAPGYRQGDGRSWWAETADGRQRLVRMLGFDGESPTVASLLDDERLQRIGRVPGDGHSLAAYGRVSVEALIKPLGVVRGISDVPWHKDCSFGRHSYDCCSLTVGISVTGADARSGQLRAVAGSHRALLWPTFVRRGTGLPEIDLPTRTGDVTVHLSCTLHMSQPPAARERRVLYTSFGLPPYDPDATQAARAKSRTYRAAAPETVSQAPAPTSSSGPMAR